MDNILTTAGFAANQIVSASDAQNHIENILESEGEITTSTVLSLNTSSIINGSSNVAINSVAGGLAHNVASGNTLTIDASGTTDPESDPIIYTYNIRSGLQTIVNEVNSPNSSYVIDTTTGSFPAGTYDISVVATDSNGATDVYNGKFAVVSNASFVAPVADAGPDITETINNYVYIDGSNSSDDVGIASYLWISGSGGQVGNNDGLSFGAGTFGTPQTRTFTLYVTDDDGAISGDSMNLILTN